MNQAIQAAKKQAEAIQTFKQKIVLLQVELPDDLDPVQAGEVYFFPNFLVYNQLVVPISYDADANLITLRTP